MEELLTIRESAARMRMSVSAFYDHVRPTLPVVSAGRRKMVRAEDLAQWTEAHRITGGVQNASAR